MVHRCVSVDLETKTQSICGALYAFVYSNPTNEHIYDKNTTPKIIIYPSGISLKPGKFEGRFAERLKVSIRNLDHVARNGQRLRFADFFKVGFVADLTSCTVGLPSTARVFERYWTEGINRFFKEQSLLADESLQNSKAEWRTIEPSSWNDNVEARLHEYLSELDSRIAKMIEVGRLSP